MAARESAQSRSQAPHRHHDQEVDEEIAHGEGGQHAADEIRGERSAQTGEPAAEREGQAEDAVDVDAERLRHAPVVHGRPHLGTETRALQAQHQRGGDEGADQDQEEAIGADLDTEQGGLPAEIIRHLHQTKLRSPDIGGTRHRHQRQADGEQHLAQLRRAVETPVEGRLEARADRADAEEGDRQRYQERPTQRIGDRDGKIAAQHGEGAMRQIDEIHHAHGDRKPDRHDEQKDAVGQAVEHEKKKLLRHMSRTWPRFRSLVTCGPDPSRRESSRTRHSRAGRPDAPACGYRRC